MAKEEIQEGENNKNNNVISNIIYAMDGDDKEETSTRTRNGNNPFIFSNDNKATTVAPDAMEDLILSPWIVHMRTKMREKNGLINKTSN